jgi:intraflagellar transport protein 46
MSSESDFADDFSDDDDLGAGRKSSPGGGGGGGRGATGSDDDDFEFGESYSESPAAGGRRGGGGGGGSKEATQVLQNQPFDEAVDLSDEDSLGTSVDTIDPQNSPKLEHLEGKSPSGGGGAAGASQAALGASMESSKRGDSPPRSNMLSGKGEYGSDEEEGGAGANPVPSGVPSGVPSASSKRRSPGSSASRRNRPRDSDDSASATGEEDDDEEEDSDDADGLESSQDATPGKAKRVKGEYNPADYEHLNVSAEVRDLWNYIGRYKPHNIELETKLKCFIPDYIPAVGEIDAFIKVPPPGKEEEGERRLGLKVLDEPASHQSDPTVLDLQLRAISKKSNLEPMVVRSLEYADKNPREIQRWVESINELHRSKPPPQVHYTKTMPDIERLMQVWPEQLEEMLKTVKLPPPAIDLDVRDYARVLCALLDIPVHQNVTESLHVLFTLYSEFSTNQHFMNVDQGAAGASAGGVGGVPQAMAEPVRVSAAELAMFDGGQRK